MSMVNVSTEKMAAIHTATSSIAFKKNANQFFTFNIKAKESQPIPIPGAAIKENIDKKSTCEAQTINRTPNNKRTHKPLLDLSIMASKIPSPDNVKTQTESVGGSEQPFGKKLLTAVKAIKQVFQSSKNFFIKNSKFMVSILEFQTHIEEALEDAIIKAPNATPQEFICYAQKAIDDALRIYLTFAFENQKSYEKAEEIKKELKIELVQNLYQEFGIIPCK